MNVEYYSDNATFRLFSAIPNNCGVWLCIRTTNYSLRLAMIKQSLYGGAKNYCGITKYNDLKIDTPIELSIYPG